MTADNWLGETYTAHSLSTLLFRVLSSFAIPVFVMLSGAFALANSKNRDYKYYYAKELSGIGIVTLVINICYFLYGNLRDFIFGFLNHKSIAEILGGSSRITDLLAGNAFYHLWYMYMMVTVFLLVPVVIRVKEDIGEKCFEKVAIIFFVMSTLGLYTSTHGLMWDPGHSFGFFGYFMMGYVISRKAEMAISLNPKKRAVGVASILVGIAVLVVLTLYLYFNGIDNYEAINSAVGAGSPAVAVGSLLIFWGFSRVHIKKDISKLAKMSFTMYLLHAGIWDVLSVLVSKEMDSRIVIPAMSICVFCLSWIAALIWQKIWGYTEQKLRVSERICKAFHLIGT